MKITDDRDKNIIEFLDSNVVPHFAHMKYIKYYEVFISENQVLMVTPEEIFEICEEQGPDFSLDIAGARLNYEKISKDIKKSTNKIVKNALKNKKPKK